jgi:hypothetical protein
VPSTPSSEDGNRSSFRNVVLSRIPDMDNVQIPSNPETGSLSPTPTLCVRSLLEKPTISQIEKNLWNLKVHYHIQKNPPVDPIPVCWIYSKQFLISILILSLTEQVGSSGHASGLYSRGFLFKSRQGHGLSWQIFRRCPRFVQENARIVPPVRPRPLPFTSFSNLLNIKPFRHSSITRL